MDEHRVLKLIKSFLSFWPDAEFGPAHIVLSDYNLSDADLGFCRNRIGLERISCSLFDNEINKELIATDLFLSILYLIPEDERTVYE